MLHLVDHGGQSLVVPVVRSAANRMEHALVEVDELHPVRPRALRGVDEVPRPDECREVVLHRGRHEHVDPAVAVDVGHATEVLLDRIGPVGRVVVEYLLRVLGPNGVGVALRGVLVDGKVVVVRNEQRGCEDGCRVPARFTRPIAVVGTEQQPFRGWIGAAGRDRIAGGLPQIRKYRAAAESSQELLRLSLQRGVPARRRVRQLDACGQPRGQLGEPPHAGFRRLPCLGNWPGAVFDHRDDCLRRSAATGQVRAYDRHPVRIAIHARWKKGRTRRQSERLESDHGARFKRQGGVAHAQAQFAQGPVARGVLDVDCEGAEAGLDRGSGDDSEAVEPQPGGEGAVIDGPHERCSPAGGFECRRIAQRCPCTLQAGGANCEKRRRRRYHKLGLQRPGARVQRLRALGFAQRPPRRGLPVDPRDTASWDGLAFTRGDLERHQHIRNRGAAAVFDAHRGVVR